MYVQLLSACSEARHPSLQSLECIVPYQLFVSCIPLVPTSCPPTRRVLAPDLLPWHSTAVSCSVLLSSRLSLAAHCLQSESSTINIDVREERKFWWNKTQKKKQRTEAKAGWNFPWMYCCLPAYLHPTSFRVHSVATQFESTDHIDYHECFKLIDYIIL